MIKRFMLVFATLALTSCATIKEKMPSLERSSCTGDETGKTLAEVFCKKQ